MQLICVWLFPKAPADGLLQDVCFELRGGRRVDGGHLGADILRWPRGGQTDRGQESSDLTLLGERCGVLAAISQEPVCGSACAPGRDY